MRRYTIVQAQVSQTIELADKIQQQSLGPQVLHLCADRGCSAFALVFLPALTMEFPGTSLPKCMFQ